MAEIEITIKPDGTPVVAVRGVAGPGCRQVSAAIEAALGEAASTQATAEYYEAVEAQEQFHVVE